MPETETPTTPETETPTPTAPEELTTEWDDPSVMDEVPSYTKGGEGGEGAEDTDSPDDDTDTLDGDADTPSDDEVASKDDTDTPSEEESTSKEESTDAADAADAADAPWKSYLQEGETPEQALTRIAAERDEYHGWATRVTSDHRDVRQEFKEYQSKVTPLLEKLQAAIEKREEQNADADPAASEPDPDLEPGRAILKRVEDLDQRLRSKEEEEVKQRQEQEEAQKQRQQEEALARLDEEASRQVISLVNEDPDFKGAYDHVNRVVFNNLKREFARQGVPPHEIPERSVRALEVMHDQRMRELVWRGHDIAQEFKEVAADMGWAPGAQGAQEQGQEQTPDPKQTASQPSETKDSSPPSEVEQFRRKAEKKNAARGATSLGGTPSRRGGKTSVDAGNLSEEDLLDMVLSGELDEAELIPELVDLGRAG